MTKIIAEAGVAHEGSLLTAICLLQEAKFARADIFKIQMYKEGMKGPNRVLPYLAPDDVITLKEKTEELGLEFLVTPHDLWALEFCEKHSLTERYKIGSGDWNLISDVKQTGKQMFISTGMKNREDMERLFSVVPPEDDHILLHCVSIYPCPPELVNLRYMYFLGNKGYVYGYSDHCKTISACLAAAAMGAQYVERHITMEQKVKGKQDTFCSSDAQELYALVKQVREIEKVRFSRPKQILPEEKATKQWCDDRVVS